MAKPTSDPSTPAHALDALSYEEAMEELEDIVAAMDNDRIPLEEMIGKYDRGTQLLKICQARLQAAQQRVEVIQAGKNGPELAAEGTAATPSPNQAKARRPAAKAPETDDDNEISLF